MLFEVVFLQSDVGRQVVEAETWSIEPSDPTLQPAQVQFWEAARGSRCVFMVPFANLAFIRSPGRSSEERS